MSVRRRRPLFASAVLVLGAGLALTACGPENTDAPAGSASSAPTKAAAGAPSAAAPAPGAPAPAGSAAP
ncbi:hypothetical protein ACFU6K_39010, partial [Kitasatospora sp. NPDC057512]